MNWNPFKKKTSPKLRMLPSNNLTIAAWRNIPNLVTETQKLFANPHFKLMLGVLQNDAPHNYGMIAKGAAPTDFVHRVGDIEGYLKCLNNMEAMATPLENNEMPEATFESSIEN